MLTCSLVLLALFASAQGRAVNISNTWVLPEEGFPVFYRYFRDRISWYEADAVCQFHHANLVTVDTTAQYDAVRAYLKELDISSAVWVGLIRSNPDGDFTWTDYRGLSGDGYWSSAPDARTAPLCAAADPAADYRWEARACGGPTVASFICELPVPQWALGNEGCMVRALPALTILYLPESAAVQLTADCGLAGVKRVQCTGNVKRDALLKDLSCNEEDELTTASNLVSGSTWSVSDMTANTTDLEAVTELTTEEDLTTEHDNEADKPKLIQATAAPILVQEKLPTKQETIINKLNSIYSQKNTNLDLIHNNNLQSNDIPKLANNENFLTLEQSEKLEDEKHMHHKMLHDELARHGNFETIFTQPTDHFVPPLVMAKSKMSDDMTVLSLAEKHAQQLAEQRFGKHNLLDEHSDHLHVYSSKNTPKITTEEPNKVEIIDKPLIMTLQPVIKESYKKDKVKTSLPKKYKEKYEDPKGRNLKIDGKLLKFEKSTEKASTTTKIIETTPALVTELNKNKVDDDTLELTVVLKEPVVAKSVTLKNIDNFKVENAASTPVNVAITENITTESATQTPYISTTHIDVKDIKKEDEISSISDAVSSFTQAGLKEGENDTTETPIKTTIQLEDVTMNHEIVTIKIDNDDDKASPTQTVFEITTLVPEFKDTVSKDNKLNMFTTDHQITTLKEDITATSTAVTTVGIAKEETITTASSEISTAPVTVQSTTYIPPHASNKITSTELHVVTAKVESVSVSTLEPKVNKTKDVKPTTELATSTHVSYTTSNEKLDIYNITETYDDYKNSTDTEAIDDLNSPLLSAANEPLHRPNRSRRPQPPPNRLNKFNPFRMLG
ncbi:uncharacterized protein LOC126376481 [Pectinophora gossypiella]|uniref:uncharacterized protein LOC126376481 n=1 Tax=Pectinophora gossypiella TaxID=13191 RepID=UPI00214E24B0|nr:uncharacterized protein LOC126376481 [Pectinophora gossypiella]